MTLMQLLACAGMITGAFLILGLKPMEFTDGLFGFLMQKPRTIKEEINEATSRKKPGVFRREIRTAQEILAMTGRESRFSMICAASLSLFCLGGSLAILMGNYFLAPVLAVGFLFFPFWYVRLTAGHYKKNVAAELETALSIITTAYLRNEDILTAVEENLHYLNPPVRNVFQEFSTQVRMVNPDVEAGLQALRGRIENDVFEEWCNALCDCQYDRSLKTTLTPIVSKLSDMRVVNAELENLVFGPRKEFITMAILVLINIPLVRFINKDWYHTLVATIPGQMVIAVCLAAVFVSFAFVVKLTQPIEYRR